MIFLPPGVDAFTALALILLSFFASALTAAFGIGGGMTMLGALAGSVSPNVVIAVHGMVQFGSNIGRAVLQKAHAHWPSFWRFLAGSVIGALIGGFAFTSLPERVLMGILGAFILAMVWLPKPRMPGFAKSGLVLGGVVSSILSMFVGATGPFAQALLLPLGLDRKAMIATNALMMTAQHGLKVIVFGFVGVALIPWLPLVATMIATGFLGTVLGTKLLEKLPERAFQVIIRGLLTVIALDLLRKAAGLTLW